MKKRGGSVGGCGKRSAFPERAIRPKGAQDPSSVRVRAASSPRNAAAGQEAASAASRSSFRQRRRRVELISLPTCIDRPMLSLQTADSRLDRRSAFHPPRKLRAVFPRRRLSTRFRILPRFRASMSHVDENLVRQPREPSEATQAPRRACRRRTDCRAKLSLRRTNLRDSSPRRRPCIRTRIVLRPSPCRCTRPAVRDAARFSLVLSFLRSMRLAV